MPAPYESFDLHYPQNPWAAVETKERTPWYYPELYQEYRRKTIWNRFTSLQYNHNGPKATELVISNLLMPHANHDPIGLRQAWLDTQYMDSFERRIKFQRYAGKLALNRYDDLVTYWTLNGVRGLSRVISEGLGHMLTNTMDKLARDAFLFQAPFALYGSNGAGSSFSDIKNNDKLNRTILQDIRLGMQERDVPFAVDEMGGYGNTIYCITTPGALMDLRRQTPGDTTDSFIEINKYTRPEVILRGEVGTMDGVRFLTSNNAMLWNAGEIIHRATIDAAISAGDGAPDPSSTAVDSVEYVGQAAATHHITVSDTSGFAVGDRVTIHVQVTSANGVADGVDYTDGKLITRRIVAKTGDDTGGTLTFARPIMEDFNVDLGGGVYGYVTKGTNIHSATFVGGMDGVAMGVAQAPTIRTPRPVDDLDMIQRFTYDMYLGYQAFNKNAYEVLFLAGTNREVGQAYTRANTP